MPSDFIIENHNWSGTPYRVIRSHCPSSRKYASTMMCRYDELDSRPTTFSYRSFLCQEPMNINNKPYPHDSAKVIKKIGEKSSQFPLRSKRILGNVVSGNDNGSVPSTLTPIEIDVVPEFMDVKSEMDVVDELPVSRRNNTVNIGQNGQEQSANVAQASAGKQDNNLQIRQKTLALRRLSFAERIALRVTRFQ